MRIAVIDLGTNTFNLLITQVNSGKLHLIHTEKESVLLGMGGINQSIITVDALNRAKETLNLFKSKCEIFHVKSIQAIGTSALRSSKNNYELVDYAKDILDIDINIIDGFKEAEYIYRGVKWGYDFFQPAIVMDIGGGSTEFIFADKKGINEMTSLDIGVSRIFQLFNKPEQCTQDIITLIYKFLNDKKSSFFTKVDADILIGSSGSFETIYEMIYMKSFTEYSSSIEIPLEKVKLTLDWIITSTLKQRLDNNWIVDFRKRMLPIAALKILWVINHFSIKKIMISPFSLKEGILMTN